MLFYLSVNFEGKGGMSTSERAAQNTNSRPSTMSSQFAAIHAAAERDDDSPSPSHEPAIKGKLDNMKSEDDMKQDIKQEDNDMKMETGGKNINNDMKQEAMDEGDIKEEKREIKEEPRTPDSSVDMKPASALSAPGTMDMMPSSAGSAGGGDKKWACIFKPDELRQKLMPTLEKLYRQDPESIPFRQPVDPQTLGIPDYFDIVKKPMDLSTIKRKLDIGQYVDPWEYVDDVWLMFDNAWLYNRKTSRVYRYCTKVGTVGCFTHLHRHSLHTIHTIIYMQY